MFVTYIQLLEHPKNVTLTDLTRALANIENNQCEPTCFPSIRLTKKKKESK